MEAKLKSLKVPELKDILAKANQPAPKATKPDLIARIIASKEATDVYNAKFAPKDDLLAPPEDLDWDVDQVNPPPEPAQSPVATPAAKPAPAPASAPAAPPAPGPTSEETPAEPTGQKTAEELEIEKRRQRAERFGIPLVEPKQPKSPAAKKAKAVVATAAKPDAPEKLSARAARFGTGQKRPAPTEDVDPEEQEKRRKRAERFGIGSNDA